MNQLHCIDLDFSVPPFLLFTCGFEVHLRLMHIFVSLLEKPNDPASRIPRSPLRFAPVRPGDASGSGSAQACAAFLVFPNQCYTIR